MPSRVTTAAPRRAASVVPGVLAALGLAVAGMGVHAVVAPASALVVPVALAVLLGNVGLIPDRTRLGLRFSAKKLLRVGIALVGLQLAARQVLDLSGARLLGIVLVVVVTFAATWWLGRLMKLGEGLPVLVAAGFSICGVSAVAAMEATVDADEEDVAFAVALVTLCGTLAIAVLPLLRGPLGLDAADFGSWVGASVHDVAQVIATASTAGARSLEAAVVVKLSRVLLLAPMVAAMALLVGKRRTGEGGSARPSVAPLFIVAFVGAVAVRSTGVLPDAVLSAARHVQQLLLGAAMAGLGASVDVRRLRRVGARPVVLGLLSWSMVAILGLVVVRVAA